MAVMEVKVPDIGDFKDVEVIEVLVKPGDTIKVEQSLITVESDKASMEIPSSAAGVVKSMRVKLGDKVNEGMVLLELEADAGAAVATPAAPAAAPAAAANKPGDAAVAQPSPAPTPAPAAAGVGFASEPRQHTPPTVGLEPSVPSPSASTQLPHASPTVRKLARELGVPLGEVKGTGPKGRISPEDVQAFVKAVMAGKATTQAAAATQSVGKPAGNGLGLNLLPWPKVDFAKFGPIRTEPLSRIKKLSGPNLARNWAMIPHVTQFDEADITELEEFRKSSNERLAKQGVKLTMLAFVMKACVTALKAMPAFNASLDESGENLILKDYVHLGFAADTPQGLVVPVLKDVDKKGFGQIATEMGELAATAREGKLKPSDMQGATFTLSSLGGVGGTAFTPIINAPEVAILGLSKSQIKPVWDGKAFQPRLMLPLSLSYDHRVIDGAMAARFTTLFGELLADMRRTLL
ncbi:Dihydrolipoyllysine-residue acetyltransferase component of pyruvate dehydrogenase complex [Thiomonas sp. X19]|uniref:dihydrolipoyllysine-residue acetyltransferase n=1 Tax=Thiomonas sp. X19 TaxID=1050370 RepID=UPI000B73A06F|nr:dihydrolipoyllysine-residue acetyltransferase [Thiomonas sp. X19]SCC92549.1 Dihydrolipoyllysine-residue acetyltransferase component of pyruvate dehydrogenase complex [Thiomonas sp. X19]